MARLGFALSGGLEPRDIVDCVKLADELGYDRRHSDSSKWRKYGADVLPLWVADTDFVSPEPVLRALHERIAHGVFGYGIEIPEFNETVVDLLYKRYGWQVSPEALVLLPGVIAGFNLACRAVTVPGDGILMQTPVYPPIAIWHTRAIPIGPSPPWHQRLRSVLSHSWHRVKRTISLA